MKDTRSEESIQTLRKHATHSQNCKNPVLSPPFARGNPVDKSITFVEHGMMRDLYVSNSNLHLHVLDSQIDVVVFLLV